jgi:hypothetical protein
MNTCSDHEKENLAMLLAKNNLRRNSFIVHMSNVQLILLWMFFFAACRSSLASLVIIIYHNETIYIASDSSGTSSTTGEGFATVQKIFKIANNHCVAVTGFAGHDIESSSGKKLFTLNIPGSLERLSAEEFTNGGPLRSKMDSVTTRVNTEYCAFYSNGAAMLGTSYQHDPTRLSFAGYDPEKQCFTISSWVLDGTNAAAFAFAKECRGFSDATPFVVQGEAHFLQVLLSGEKPELTKLVSAESLGTVADLVSTNDVSDNRLKSLILEMFQLHKANAVRLGYDKGWVGPPYRIFKVMKTNVVELTSDARPARAEPQNADADNPNEKAIDAIMDGFRKSFMAGDYAYAVDRMYTPIVEKMGGRANLRATVTNAMAQMKEQHVVMISWETKKPYHYVNGESRIYAVVPYQGVMTIGGRTFRQESYQLGIKLANSPWEFVNGDSLTPELFGEFFPDFPKSFALPKVERGFE